jgi:hypothetical protein
MTVEFVDGAAPTFKGLQKNTAAVTKNAGDARGRVMGSRLRQYGVRGFGVVRLNSATGIKKSDQHDENPWKIKGTKRCLCGSVEAQLLRHLLATWSLDFFGNEC